MPAMPPASSFDQQVRSPRAQFFANRAYAHAHAITTFEQIHELVKTVQTDIVPLLTLKHRATTKEL